MSPAAGRTAATPWNLIELPDADSVAEQVAGRLLSQRRLRPEQPLGLATGRTMDPVYRALERQVAQLPEAELGRLRERWLSFNLDEYVGLKPGDRCSFRSAMLERLAGPLGIDPERVRLPDGGAADPEAAARRYGEELRVAGGIGLQVLGLGLNGHVGFNEPPCTPEASCRCVALSETTRHANAPSFGGDLEAIPRQAITLGLREILAARSLLLVVTGPAKGPILRRLLNEPPSPDLPASWLRQHPNVTVLADRAALG